MRVFITGESITLSQFLKKTKLIATGGQAKSYLANNEIAINDNKPRGKNSRILVGSRVKINGTVYHVLTKVA